MNWKVIEKPTGHEHTNAKLPEVKTWKTRYYEANGCIKIELSDRISIIIDRKNDRMSTLKDQNIIKSEQLDKYFTINNFFDYLISISKDADKLDGFKG